MSDKQEIYRAIGEFAYVIAMAEDGLHVQEKEAFMDILTEELRYDAWSAIGRFEILEKVHPTIEHAYNAAMFEFKKHKEDLTPELKQLTIDLMKKIAASYHNSQVKDFIVDRLEHDLKSL